MGKGQGSSRRTRWVGAFVVGLMLALAVPSIALASPVAFFQYVNPAPGSSSIATSRMLSVTVYDRYGVRYMSNMTMSLDGVKVTPTWKPWAGYGFRKFTLKYAAMNMSVGTHTAAVRIHDRANHTVNYSWSFNVLATPVPPGTTSHAAPAIACTVVGCHGGKDVATIHLAVGCTPCHAPGATPATNCTVCHGANGPADHQTHVTVSSASTPACTQAGCHAAALVGIHATCATCHDSTNATVVAAIAAGGATCETCHGVQAVAHVPIGTAHTVSGSCFASTCHGTDVTKMHTNDFRGTGATPPGCAACHGAGKTPSTNCTTCHADTITPHDFVSAHARVQPLLATNSTACVACHGSDIKNVLPAGNSVTGVIEHDGCSCHAYFEARNKTACEGCHNGAHAPHGFTNGVSRGEGWFAASGHNTANFGTIGAKSKFDGTQGVTLKWESEIASSTLNSAYQTALGVSSLAAGQVGTLTTTWTFPTVNVFWSANDAAAPPTAIKALTKDSVVTCQDCHTGLNATGPHGAAQNWGIDPNYPGDYSYAELTKWVVTNPAGIKVRSTLETMTAMPAANATNPVTGDLATYYQGATGAHAVICAKCHDLENIGTGTAFGTTSLPYWDPIGKVATTTVTPFINTAAVGAANTAHGSHHQDQADGSPQCVNCHIAIPHGWKAPRLLVNTGKGALGVPAEVIAGDAAPFLSPNALGTLRDGGGTGAIQFNKIGMLTLSATDQHTLTNGAAFWSEPSCQGCNIHLGEDGVRIQSGD